MRYQNYKHSALIFQVFLILVAKKLLLKMMDDGVVLLQYRQG